MATDNVSPGSPSTTVSRSLQSPSLGSDNRVSDGSAISSNMISIRRTSSAASSWITCSDRSMPGQSTTSAVPLLSNITPSKTHHPHKTPSESRLANMLFAIDRKKKQKLFRGGSANSDVAKATAASETLNSTRPQSTPIHSSKKLQPRGATERQSVSDLRAFFKSDPARPQNDHRVQVVKSTFDWDDDDDEVDDDGTSISQVRNSNLQSLHRMTRRWQAAMVGSGNEKAAGDLHGTGLSVDAWMASAQKYAEGRRGDTVTSMASSVDRATNEEMESMLPRVDNKRRAAGRRSVLKLFDDPVWNNDEGSDNIGRGIGESQHLANRETITKAIVSSESADQVRSSSPSETGAGISTPTKSEVKVDWFFGTPPLPKSFRYVDWSKHGRGLSIVESPVHAPDAPQMPISKFAGILPENRIIHKASKTSVFQRLKSQLFELPEVPSFAGLEPQRPSSTKPSPVPKFSIPLRRGKSAEDLRRKKNSDDPFTDDAIENAMPDIRMNGRRRSLDANARRFNDDMDSPTKVEKQVEKQAIYPVYPELGIYTTNKADLRQSPPTPSVKTPKSTGSSTPVKGYPKGPEDPNWDDAVKRVKKIVQEREKREAEESHQLRKELKMQEKKMEKLQAGKDVVLRGSHYGLKPKKSLDEITEDEFEAVGGLATTPSKDASISKKRGIFSMLFTKILGNNQEKEDHIEKTKSKLEKQKSLEVLNFAFADDNEKPLVEHRDQYEKALRALNGENSPSKASFKDKSTTEASEDRSNHRGVALHETSSPTVNKETTRPALGITAATEKQSPKRNTSKSYKDFITLKRQRQNLEPEDEDASKKRDGMALSDIAEEDAENHANPTREQDNEDASSWCTESIHSIDQIERMIESDHDSGPPQVSMPNFSRDVEHTTNQYSGCYAPSNGQDDCLDDDAASKYSDQIDMDAMPAPLDIRVLRVKSSSVHTHQAHRNAFIPDRKASFHAKIQEVSRLHQAHIGSLSHPALRGTSKEDKKEHIVTYSAPAKSCATSIDPKSNRDSLDSGIGLMPDDQPEHLDKGYATGLTQQQEWSSLERSKSPLPPKTPTKSPLRNVSAPLWKASPPVAEKGEDVDDIDLGALRTEVGVGPLRLALSSSSMKHPHHPFTWNHEKVMCRQIHNSIEVLPGMPPFAENRPVNMSRVDSNYFTISPTKNFTMDAKKCESKQCGSFCCRFANLVALSKLNSGGDIMEEMVRMKAQQRASMLRTYHPNGIEEYETFLECARCGHKICPKCATKCIEQLCQSIVCSDCCAESGVCPVHESH